MKKLLIFCFIAFSIHLNAFALSNENESMFNTIVVILIIALVIGLLLFVDFSKKGTGSKSIEEVLEARNLFISKMIRIGKYVGGHPQIDDVVDSVSLHPSDDAFEVFKTIWIQDKLYEIPEKIAAIKFDSIKNVTIEDSSSIEKKITLGRVLLVGVFALGWRKKKKNELAFLNIEWFDGRFNHSTLFSFESKDSFQKANKARNSIIKQISSEFS